MAQLLTLLIDLLFPPDPDDFLVRNSNQSDILKLYEQQMTLGVLALSSYKHCLIKAAILENKFYHNKKAATLLASLVSHWYEKQKGSIIFVPIPLSKERFKQRGHNQALTVLLATSLQLDIKTAWLQRTRDTKPQSNLLKQARLENVANAFVYNNKEISIEPGTTVVLFDDVVTTGATMKAARAELAPHLPPHTRLICLALAH